MLCDGALILNVALVSYKFHPYAGGTPNVSHWRVDIFSTLSYLSFWYIEDAIFTLVSHAETPISSTADFVSRQHCFRSQLLIFNGRVWCLCLLLSHECAHRLLRFFLSCRFSRVSSCFLFKGSRQVRTEIAGSHIVFGPMDHHRRTQIESRHRHCREEGTSGSTAAIQVSFSFTVI